MPYIYKVAAVAACALMFWWSHTPNPKLNSAYPDRTKMRRVW